MKTRYNVSFIGKPFGIEQKPEKKNILVTVSGINHTDDDVFNVVRRDYENISSFKIIKKTHFKRYPIIRAKSLASNIEQIHKVFESADRAVRTMRKLQDDNSDLIYNLSFEYPVLKQEGKFKFLGINGWQEVER